MKLTRSQIKGLVPVLRALSGPADKPYLYDEKTRYAVAKNLVLLSRYSDEMDKYRAGAFKALLPEGKDRLEQDSPEHKALVDQLTKYYEESVEIPNLMQVTMDPFVKAGTPFDLIQGLDPILTGVDVPTP